MSGFPAWSDEKRLQVWLGRIVIDAKTGCWLWQGQRDASGYGIGSSRGQGRRRKRIVVHRFFYEELVGAIPKGCELHHECRNPGCTYPRHLTPVTRSEHLRRHPRPQKRPTHCKRGHEFTSENTYVDAKGFRYCRACGRIRANKLWAEKRYARQKEAV